VISRSRFPHWTETRCPAARPDVPVYDHAFPVWRDFDADYSEALSKPDGRSRFSPANIGALGDPCHREGAPPGRIGFILNDRKYGHRIRVQMFSR
jgi:hypothetical protein